MQVEEEGQKLEEEGLHSSFVCERVLAYLALSHRRMNERSQLRRAEGPARDQLITIEQDAFPRRISAFAWT